MSSGVTPFYTDDWLTLYGGDCREVLASLPPDGVDCVVTSPPYWGLRDYGTEGQLGLERTPEEYVANMVAVFREVKRVLKPTGTCWLNLGDSYGHGTDAKRERSQTSAKVSDAQHEAQGGRHGGMAKQLIGIPWRVAFALQADGWYLRSDIIWSKPNPMPESVTDRPTKSHEYIFLLTKSPKYYFDADAVRESVADATLDRLAQNVADQKGSSRANGGAKVNGPMRAVGTSSGRNIRSVWNIATVPYGNVKIGDAEGGHRDTLSPDCPVHSLRAIRRSLRTDGDDALLDHLRSRSPRNGSRPVPMPADGLFATLDLDSPDPDQSTPDSLPAGSSPEPMLGSAHASRTPAPPTSADGQESDAGTEYRTSHTPSPTIGQDAGGLSGPGAPLATGRSGRESRTSAESEQPDSASPEPSLRTPDTDAPLGADEPHQHTDGSSSAEDSAGRDPDAQTGAGTSGKCTCPDYSASHFAVFPPELPERCIKAGSSERGVCPECGAPWERVVERQNESNWEMRKELGAIGGSKVGGNKQQIGSGWSHDLPGRDNVTTGWRPTCAHTADPIPAVILDPFGGSGTVGMVANRLSRRAILIDLNPEYLKQQMERNAQTPLGLSA